MFIDRNKKRINIHAPYEQDGIRYANLTDPTVRELIGVTEFIDPQPPQEYIDNPEYFIFTETDEFPYGVYTKRPDEVITQIKHQKAKQERQKEVDNLTVTTASGKVFDADETSQGRIARAIVGLEKLETITWVLANNTVAEVTREELVEALRLAGAKQSEVWIRPYQ